MDSDHGRSELWRDLRALRKELDRLDRRVYALELQTVKRNGPLVDELHSASKGIDSLRQEVASREELRRELTRQTNELEKKRREAFGAREKIIAALLALGVFGLNVYQVVWH